MLSLLFALQLVAQGPSADEAWRWAHFTRATGLPSDVVRVVVEGVDGPWALTDAGLAWYDGYWWHPVEDGIDPPLGRVEGAEPLPEGGILVVIDNRLYAGGRNGLRHVPVVVDGDTLSVTDAAPVGRDRAMVVSVSELLVVPLDGTGRVERLEPPATLQSVAPLATLRRTRSGALWLGADARLWRSRDGGRTWTSFLPPHVLASRVSHLAESAGGGVLAIDHPLRQQGVWTWRSGEAPRRAVGEGAVDVAEVAVTDGGRPLVVYTGAEVRTRTADREDGWRSVEAPLVPGQSVSAVAFRPGDDLWIATDEGLHLYRATSRLWRSWRHPFPDLRNRVHDILPLADGTVWIATDGGVEVRRPDGTVRWHRAAAGVSLDNATGLARGPEGGIWVVSGGGFRGVLRYRDGRWSRVPVEGSGRDHHFHRVRAGPDGTLWFLGLTPKFGMEPGEGPGIFALDGDRVRRLSLSDSLPSGRIYDVSAGPGTLWVATSGGLSRRSGDGTWRHWDADDGLKLSRVFVVQGDGAGGAWFADQSSGLGHVDAAGSVRYRTEADGLVDDEVWGLLADGNALWIATGMGVSRFDGEAFSSLRTEQGLPAVRIWPLARSGDELLAGSRGAGVAILDLSEVSRAPAVRVVGAEVTDAGARATWVTASEWGVTDPGTVQTRWRLDGGPWSSWSTERSVLLAGLAPGEHAFEVQARGLLGGASDPAPAASFRIEPPVWQRVLFLAPLSLLLVLLASVLAFAAIRRRAYRRALEESRERYRRFFRDDLTGDFLLDSEGRIADCNEAFARIFGYDRPEDAVGRSGWELLPDHDTGIEIIRALRSRGRLGEREIELERRDGRPVHVVANLVGQFDEAGMMEEIRGYIFDDTERKDLERRLVEARRIEAVGRLAGGIAHEFNNLLAAIGGYASLLLADLHPDDTRRHDLEEILDASRRGKELTGHLLAFGRRRVRRAERLDVNDVLRSMESLVRRMCEGHGTLRVRYQLELPPVQADPEHLEQVVMHLVLNARDALDALEDDGTILVSTGLRKRDGRGDPTWKEGGEGGPSGPWVVVEVRDDGRGMTAEERNRMFEPFFTTKPEGKGSGGLGLAMVYGLVRQNEGFVEVESAPGEGTRVRVYLPTADSSVEVGAGGPRGRPPRPGPGGGGGVGSDRSPWRGGDRG